MQSPLYNLSFTYTIVNIQNTYVCIQPLNKSRYACKKVGTAILPSNGIIPYQSPSIMTPDKRFANRRSEIEIGFANSPIKFIGKRTGSGWKSHVKCPTPWFLIPWNCTIANVKRPRQNVTP